MKNIGCIGCHQLGQASTRTMPTAFTDIKSHEEAWMRRIQSGQSGEQMTNQLAGNFGGAPYKYLGEWTERVAKGELPFAKPQRPQGVERNVVVTSWEWSTEKHYLHDLIAPTGAIRRSMPTGRLYGSPEYSTDNMPILDPRSGKVTTFKMPVADPSMPEALGPGHAASVVRWRLPRIGAKRNSGTRAPTTTTRCSTSRAAYGWRRPCATGRTPRSARRARIIRRPKSSRSRCPRGRWRCSIRRR
jgi:hypothetical protein